MAIMAASEKWSWPNSMLNLCTKSFTAPGSSLQVASHRTSSQNQLGVLQHVVDVRHNGRLVHTDREHLGRREGGEM